MKNKLLPIWFILLIILVQVITGCEHYANIRITVLSNDSHEISSGKIKIQISKEDLLKAVQIVEEILLKYDRNLDYHIDMELEKTYRIRNTETNSDLSCHIYIEGSNLVIEIKEWHRYWSSKFAKKIRIEIYESLQKYFGKDRVTLL